MSIRISYIADKEEPTSAGEDDDEKPQQPDKDNEETTEEGDKQAETGGEVTFKVDL